MCKQPNIELEYTSETIQPNTLALYKEEDLERLGVIPRAWNELVEGLRPEHNHLMPSPTFSLLSHATFLKEDCSTPQ